MFEHAKRLKPTLFQGGLIYDARTSPGFVSMGAGTSSLSPPVLSVGVDEVLIKPLCSEYHVARREVVTYWGAETCIASVALAMCFCKNKPTSVLRVPDKPGEM